MWEEARVAIMSALVGLLAGRENRGVPLFVAPWFMNLRTTRVSSAPSYVTLTDALVVRTVLLMLDMANAVCSHLDIPNRSMYCTQRDVGYQPIKALFRGVQACAPYSMSCVKIAAGVADMEPKCCRRVR